MLRVLVGNIHELMIVCLILFMYIARMPQNFKAIVRANTLVIFMTGQLAQCIGAMVFFSLQWHICC